MFTLLIKICFITFDRRIRESKKNRCISISISFFFIREVFKFDERVIYHDRSIKFATIYRGAFNSGILS